MSIMGKIKRLPMMKKSKLFQFFKRKIFIKELFLQKNEKWIFG